MTQTHASAFAAILADREMTGSALARAVGTTESRVSNIRNGLRPGKTLQERICATLNLSDEEIVALGWDRAEEATEA